MTVAASASHTAVLTTTTPSSSSLLSPNSTATTTTTTTATTTAAAVTAGATATQSRIARSKSGADLLFDKMKQDQLNHDIQNAVDFLNTTLIDNDNHTSIEIDHLHDELKDGVLLCKYVKKKYFVLFFFLLLFTILCTIPFLLIFFAMFFTFTYVKKE